MSVPLLNSTGTAARRDVLTAAWQLATSRTWAALLLALLAVSMLSCALALRFAPAWFAPINGTAAHSRFLLPIPANVPPVEFFRDVWFRLLTALFAFSLLLRLGDRLGLAIRARSNARRLQEILLLESEVRVVELPGAISASDIAARIAARPRSAFRRVWVDEGGDCPVLVFVDRMRLAVWGDLMLHLGALLLIAALFVGNLWGWSEPDIALAAGESYQFAHLPYALTVQSVGGGAVSTSPDTRLTLKPPDGGERSMTLATGAPLFVAPVGLFQVKTGPALRVTVANSTGESLFLQPPASKSPPASSVAVKFAEDTGQNELTVPGLGLYLRIDRYPSLPDEGYWMPVYLVRAYQGDRSTPLFARHVWQRDSFDWQGNSFQMAPETFALLNVAADPGWLLLPPGFLLLILGIVLRRIPAPMLGQAAVNPNGEATRVAVTVWHASGQSAGASVVADDLVLSLRDGPA